MFNVQRVLIDEFVRHALHSYRTAYPGLAAEPAILSAIRATGRNQVVLVGLETDVCVAHSALGLQRAGLAVAVLADATGSPGSGRENGLRRMAGAGVLVSDVKSLYYEWLRTVDAAVEFRLTHFDEIGRPPGVIL